MRVLRLLAFFLVGVLVGTWAVFAHAETIAATAKTAGTYSIPRTQGYQAGQSGPGGWYTTFGEACDRVRASYSVSKGVCNDTQPNVAWQNGFQSGLCYYNTSGTSCGGMTSAVPTMTYSYCPTGYTESGANCVNNTTVYVCPATGGWTLSGTSCTRPDCLAGETRQADGSCLNPCSGKTGTLETKQYKYTGDGTAVGQQTCTDQCATTLLSKTSPYYSCGFGSSGIGFCYNVIDYKVQYTGATCTGANPSPPGTETPIPSHKPKCNAGEGVLTSSSGTVACVPAGTPDTSIPSVSNTTKTETYGDGSTKVTTTTTTTDPKTGASDVTQTVVTSGGLAGPAGTVTSNVSSSADSTGDGRADGGGGDCDPKKEACGGSGTFGAVDKLYEPKYPDGLSGLLSDKYAEMKASPLFGIVGQLAPQNLPNAGTCPSWNFNLNFGNGMNLGTSTVDVPCWIWDVVKTIMIISSLLLARRLIFGG